MRFNLHRRRKLGQLKDELRTIMIDYGISEAYLDGDIRFDNDNVRPEHIWFYYFIPKEQPDFDRQGFERMIRERFHGQVISGKLSTQETLIDVLRKRNITLF